MENDTQMLEIAFSNLSEEFKELRQQYLETKQILFDLKEKVEGFEQKINTLKITVPPINTVPITETINKGIDKIKSTIEQQPKSVIRQFRILLFPEFGAGEYYKLAFGRVLFWMLIFLAATYLFALGSQYIELNATVQINKLENDDIRKAWKYLYKNNGKAVRNKMDSAWIKNTNNL